MTIPEKAVEFCLNVAEDNSHGYDQGSRWGTPDFDCSSLIISAYKSAGLPLTCTYTGNMRSDFFNNGFSIPAGVDLTTGAGLQPGDVLLNEKHHTAIYIGNKQIVHATGNEKGGATGGKPGDQTGKEICKAGYFNFPWDYVLRYVRKEEEVKEGDTYIVKKGDSLWSIAEKLFGNGGAYILLMTANHLNGSTIYPGQELIIPGKTKKKTITITVKEDTFTQLNILASDNLITLGAVVDMLVEGIK